MLRDTVQKSARRGAKACGRPGSNHSNTNRNRIPVSVRESATQERLDLADSTSPPGALVPCSTAAAHPRAARLRRRHVRVSRRRPGTSPARIPMSHRPWKPLCIDLEYIVIPGRAQSRGPRAIQTFRVGNPPSAEEDRVFELLLEPDFESTRTPVAVGNGSRDRALAAGSRCASVCGECGTGRDREQRRELADR